MIVVIGSKPEAVLPDVPARIVIAANAAIVLAERYREKYNSKIVSMVASGELKERKIIQENLIKSIPDEIIVIGEKIDSPEKFIRNDLGLQAPSVKTISFEERFRMMKDIVGWKASFATLRGHIKYLLFAPKKLLAPYQVLHCSTGAQGILYGLRIREENEFVVSSGIGLLGGRHFYGEGKMSSRRARVDRLLFRIWTNKHKQYLYTTDSDMARFGKVNMFDGFSL